MKVTKCVWQYHNKKNEFEPVFDYFKYCANEAIRIGIEKNLTSKFNLHYQLYHILRLDSQFHCKYVYGALECAASKLKLYKKIIKKKPDAKKPHVSTNHLIMDNMSYKIDQDIIRIPTEPEKYVFIKLTKYVLEKIRNMKLGQITITIDKLIISYSKEIPVHKSTNFLGIDRNLNNLTTCDSSGDYIIHDLANAQKIITLYGIVKSKFKRNDVRIRKRIFQKW
ncbi:hypothetical protein [Candidatus Nitrosotalea okcheonensis]|uniref:Transposase n=1 Tax=Candidatus Nitrosotalea okcheonensis TaxID=1903276 RepID=A0A2H1FH59_9ARCH|nr:hypothetical protein [Candidatus Nitrosotalea okcheonensis]SMH72091.1 protein of unknown function [Candidatus Nitrosotalea okcheonensis]